MKILMFGTTGQVATEVLRRVPAGVTVEAIGRDVVDLADAKACADLVMGADADVILNAAAWTAVDKAETEEAAAMAVNGAAPTAMARAAARRGLPFLHISTDYVFDGTGAHAFKPTHPTAPLGAYGRTKLAGEHGIHAAGARHVILRTSWVFSAHGTNFLKTMLRLGATRESLNVVADQIGGPTPASAIADACLAIAAALASGHSGGTYHFAGAPDTSWADFARAIMATANLPCTIHDIPSSAYPTPATRPLNSRLDCTTTETDFGIRRPDWRAAITDIVKELS
ncbi:MAG: dTDP-4-dehydrorhamnose reductase [Rhodobacteraceae bacterium]|jgi:dTDP-4-dehydrorhamnose reductase|nr:dTDP-4-dehydrorhamnose reductase [Paracoccaceae bacterium]